MRGGGGGGQTIGLKMTRCGSWGGVGGEKGCYRLALSSCWVDKKGTEACSGTIVITSVKLLPNTSGNYRRKKVHFVTK